jgi:hypothetical protein
LFVVLACFQFIKAITFSLHSITPCVHEKLEMSWLGLGR